MFLVFDTNQFAYRRCHGARDAILYVLLIWLFAMAQGKKVGVYCIDVAGRFDRRSSLKPLSKLGRSIIPPSIVCVIADCIVGRRGEVIVQGFPSDSFPQSKMTFRHSLGASAMESTV